MGDLGKPRRVVVSSGHIAGGAPLESALYLVRKGATGVKVGGRFDGLGLRGNDSTPVTIEGLVVDEGDYASWHHGRA